MSRIFAQRYHDISAGHRVVNHEGKCQHLHGHNYRVHFTIEASYLDEVGRVLDFGIIKSELCQWLEDNWDHRMLIYERDPWLDQLLAIDPDGIQVVPFNPTAEEMGRYLVEEIGPDLMAPYDCTLVKVRIEETRKCSGIVITV